MAKGDLSPSEHSWFKDRATGALVHSLTSHPSISHTTYFLQSSFTPDGHVLIFTSYRGGSAQLYEVCKFPDGPIRQLTEGIAIHPYSPAIHPDGRRIFFVRGGALWALDRETLEERKVVEFEGGQMGECSLGDRGAWITAAIKWGGRNGIVAGRTDGSDFTFIPYPRTVIHPQFHPLEPEWIEFAADPAPRMHRVRRDGGALECLFEHGNDEFVVHETFLGVTGDLVYTIWPRALMRMDWTTREHREIAAFNAWHIRPDSLGGRVLCDTNHPDDGIFLVDAADGNRVRVCLSEASNGGSQWRTSRYAMPEDFAAAARSHTGTGALSWMEVSTDTVYGPQWTHPHPTFSPDERYVAFASDRSGYTQVYVADLASIDPIK